MTAPVIPIFRSIKRLDSGVPHFRFYHLGSGVYEVFVSCTAGDDLRLGKIVTTGTFARGIDRGKWRLLAEQRAFDSMNEAAEELLKGLAPDETDRSHKR